MKILSIVLAFCAWTPFQAQNWDLFPLDQRSYFLDRAGWEGEVVNMYLMDSVMSAGQEDVLYFRERLMVEGAAACTEAAIANLTLFSTDPFSIDSLVRRNDTVFYRHWGVTAPFHFLPNAALGQSWTVTSTHASNTYQQITITCSSITQETIMGVTDSLKTFTMIANGSSPGQTPVSDFTMQLSRTHGLLEFVPFELFLVHPPQADFKTILLIGFESDGLEYGFRPPNFDDYFHPSAGDVLLWEEHFDPGQTMNDPWTRYHLDTITAVEQNADSIVILYDRLTQFENLSTLEAPGSVQIITSNGYQSLVECSPNWLAAAANEFTDIVPNTPALWTSTGLMLHEDISGTDTIVEYELMTDHTYVDTSTCSVVSASDIWHDFKVDTRAGIVRQCQRGNSNKSWCMTLIGSLIAGDQEGPITLSIGALAKPVITSLLLFPNPARDRLLVRGIPPGVRALYEVRDVTGALKLTGTIEDGSISTTALTGGAYILRIVTAEGVSHGKFIKD